MLLLQSFDDGNRVSAQSKVGLKMSVSSLMKANTITTPTLIANDPLKSLLHTAKFMIGLQVNRPKFQSSEWTHLYEGLKATRASLAKEDREPCTYSLLLYRLQGFAQAAVSASWLGFSMENLFHASMEADALREELANDKATNSELLERLDALSAIADKVIRENFIKKCQKNFSKLAAAGRDLSEVVYKLQKALPEAA